MGVEGTCQVEDPAAQALLVVRSLTRARKVVLGMGLWLRPKWMRWRTPLPCLPSCGLGFLVHLAVQALLVDWG